MSATQTPNPVAITVTTPTSGTVTAESSIPLETVTPGITVITPTPEAPDVLAAATLSIQLTEQAVREGTPTPLPRHVRVATRTPTPRVVTATPTAANSATATFHAVYATAVAVTTGTPYIVIATPTPTRTSTPTRTPKPTPTPTPTSVVVTPTPRPANVLEAATRKAAQEALAQQGITPTPLPDNFVVATVTPTPRIVTNTPTAANDATATVHAIFSTAIAYTTGVPNIVTATPTEGPTPIDSATPVQIRTVAATRVLTATATFTPEPTHTAIFTPLSEPPVAQRIRFAPGTTSTTVVGYVDFDQPIRYTLHARAGQATTIELSNPAGYPALVVIGMADGTFVGAVTAGERWVGELPSTQDYYLTIELPADSTGHTFELFVEIVP
jgi:hypothetical protein